MSGNDGEREVAEDYKSALADLHINSKPLITFLTMLADENKAHASAITQVVTNHIKETTYKLPAMYLVDSIVKNVGGDYKRLFGNSIANIFTGVFKEVDEKTRKKLYELRQTWNEVFPKSRLFHLDTNIHEIDPAWPITSQPRIGAQPSTIHVNPNKFKPHALKSGVTLPSRMTKLPEVATSSVTNTQDIEELKQLQSQKRVLEETRKKVEKMMKEKETTETPAKVAPNIYIAPWKAKQILPNITTPTSLPPVQKDPRIASTSSRDPRVSLIEAMKETKPENHDPLKPQRDPRSSAVHRESGPSHRDPRLVNKCSTTLAPSLKSCPTPTPTPATDPVAAPAPVSDTVTATAAHVHTIPNTAKDLRLTQPELKKNEKTEKEKPKIEKDPPGKVKKEKDLKAKDSSDSKKEKDKDRHKDKERFKSKEREKDKKKQIENTSALKTSHEREEKETKMKVKKEIKNKDGKDKVKEKTAPPKEPSKDTEHLNKSNSKAKSDQSSSPTSDKFKAKNEGSVRTKRREHIRPRIESPEEDVKSEGTKQVAANGDGPQNTNENNGISTTSIGNGAEKRSKTGKDSDSEDSDHYDANKPQPSLYANKKEYPPTMKMPETSISEVQAYTPQQVKAEVVGSSLTPSSDAKHTFENQAIDTDMRQLASQPERIPPPAKTKDEIVELPSNKAQCLGLGLFGKEDVDLRQLSMPTHFPGLPSNPTGGLNPFLGKPDEDMRIPSDHRKTQTFRDSQDPRVTKVVDAERREYLKSPRRDESLLGDMNSKKPSFNSPHAAKWEKFREKNPEFKEYQRQASSAEKIEMEGEIIELDDKSHPSRERGFGRRGRTKEYRRPYRDGDIDDFGDRERRSASPLEGHPGDENYQYMITQLSEQFKRGEISRNEYGRCMENIRFMVEQGKIRELQAKEGRWSPGMRQREGRGAGPWNRQFATGSGPLVEKFHGNKGEGKWPEGNGPKMVGGWHRGRGGRGGSSTRGFPVNYRTGGSGPHQPRFDDDWTGDPDLPSITEDVLRTVFRESETRTIEIDGEPREIRTYGERAVVLMDWNEPRRIAFEPVQCDIVFDGGELVLAMHAGESSREFIIDGETHRVKLGVPTQELLIDGKGYQCFFGGKPITVHLAGKNRTVSLHGRPPKVNIGTVRSHDYLLGKIELIINAKKFIPLYLDAKPQRFTIDGMPFVIKFIDSFLAVTINGMRFPVEFGGLPISISVRGYRRFLRFSSLPAGVIPGQTTVKGMDADGNTLIPSYPSSPPPTMDAPVVPQFNAPGLLPPGGGRPPLLLHTPTAFPTPTPPSTTFSQGPLPPYPPQDNLGMPLGVVPVGPPPQVVGIVPGSYLTTAEDAAAPPLTPHPSMSAPGPVPLSAFPQPPPPSSLSSSIDVQELLDRLVKTGIIGGGSKKEAKKEGTKEGKEERKEARAEEEEEDLDDLKDLPPFEVMFKLDNLRKRNQKLIKRMYRGMQCSSCGLRYPPEQTQQYSHHLDWHFRMNKKQQESTKKVNTRKFYLCFEDWIQYEEIEDLEERVPSMFEVEGQMSTKTLENDDDDGEEEIPSIAVSSDPSLGVCPICHETFDQFYHQNTEEWHYKYAIQVDGINYHPGCHQDFMKIQKQEEERLKKEAAEIEKKHEDTVEVNEEDIELEEVKVEDEEIQEIEKEIDTKPKEEIDLTVEDDKMEEIDLEDPRRRKEDKVTEALEKMRLLSNGLPPSYRIKEEPMDAEGELNVVVSKAPPILADIPVKVEIEDDASSEPPSFEIDDDDVNESESGEVPSNPWIAPAPLSTAQTDIASSIDGNTELFISTETSEATTAVPKIKISVSIPTQNNIENQLNANNSSNPHSDGEDLTDTTNHIEEFVPPPFTVDLQLKPAFRGVRLSEQPIALRGVEISALCSIM